VVKITEIFAIAAVAVVAKIENAIIKNKYFQRSIVEESQQKN
jgi:hypothetical protein